MLNLSLNPRRCLKISRLILTLFLAVSLHGWQAADPLDQMLVLHKSLPGYNGGGHSLVEAMKRDPDQKLNKFSAGPATGILGHALPSGKEQFEEHACDAEAILIARVKRIRVGLPLDESQVFTDYELLPQAVLKRPRNTLQDFQSTFFVTQPGGIFMDGGEIRDLGDLYPPALFPNKTYLLFLKALPDSKSFQIGQQLNTYFLDGDSVRAVTTDIDRNLVNQHLSAYNPATIGRYLADIQATCAYVR